MEGLQSKQVIDTGEYKITVFSGETGLYLHANNYKTNINSAIIPMSAIFTAIGFDGLTPDEHKGLINNFRELRLSKNNQY